MFKIIILYLAIGCLVFIGADKALTQVTEESAINLSIPGEPYALIVTVDPATFTDLPYPMTAGETFNEDLGEFGRTLQVTVGDFAPLELTYMFNEMVGPVTVPNGGNVMKTWAATGPINLHNGASILAPNTPSQAMVYDDNIPTDNWSLKFTYFKITRWHMALS